MQSRVNSLLDFYRWVQQERMQGIALLNPVLNVEVVGALSSEDGQDAVVACVLITPWFMSLVRLPLVRQDHPERIGRKRIKPFGNERFEFIGACDPALGFYETCAMFSSMAEFRSQTHASETAQAVVDQLRQVEQTNPPVQATPELIAPMPSRRAFFLPRPTPPGRQP